jgi:hypothetical protein
MNAVNDDFFGNAPQNYEVPKSDSKYMSFKTPGKYTFRILQAPIFGWEGWKVIDGKNVPVRFPMDEKPSDTSSFKEGRINHFWAMPVFNFNTGKVEVLEITQKTVQEAIEAYARSEWGSPLGYNLTVTREGTGRDDTKYTTMNGPKSELSEEAKAAWAEVQKEGFNIKELFEDGDPFEPTTHASETAPEKTEAATTLAENQVEEIAEAPADAPKPQVDAPVEDTAEPAN